MCLKTIQKEAFEKFIVLVIVLNSIVLALADYNHVDSSGNLVAKNSWRNTLLLESEVYFTVVFTVECVIKITALGFYGSPQAYCSDRWNWIDFAVVISG